MKGREISFQNSYIEKKNELKGSKILKFLHKNSKYKEVSFQNSYIEKMKCKYVSSQNYYFEKKKGNVRTMQGSKVSESLYQNK